MATPLDNLNKTVLYQQYNLVKVYDGETLMKSLSTIKPNHFYAEYTHKENESAPKWFLSYMENFKKEIDEKFCKIETRLNNIVKLNNLKE